MKRLMMVALVTLHAAHAMAQLSVRIPMTFVDEKGIGASVGVVVVTESKYGLVFTPALSGLPPEHDIKSVAEQAKAARTKFIKRLG